MREKSLILVIDDTLAVHESVKLVLEKKPIDILEAYDGKEGLQKAIQHKPDFILLDIEMPVMNGIETIKHLKQNPETAHIPVIVCTAQPRINAQEHGAQAVLEKPFSPNALWAIMRAAIKTA